jgi:hypothetical protein
MQTYLWSTTGEMQCLENFEQNKQMYTIGIIMMDANSKSIIKTYSFKNVPSTMTPLVNILPDKFDVSLSNQIILLIQDNTYYASSSQIPLQLILQISGQKQPMYLNFTTTQSLNNIKMRSVTTPSLPYTNITLYFNNNPK